jgi:hypothetical protein
MSWEDIKEEIYTLVEGLTTTGAPVYNFNWVTRRRPDTYMVSDALAYFALHYPEDEDFEEDVSEEYNATSLTRFLARNVEFHLRVRSDATTLDPDTVKDLNNDANDRALKDIRLAFGSDTLNTCNKGIHEVNYVSAGKKQNTAQSAYYPYSVRATYRIIYKEPRRL